MARIKAVKVQACATRAEFEEAVDAAAKCSVQREKLVAALKARHQAIDDKYGAEIKALDADIKAFGTYNAEVKLYPGIAAKVFVVVTEE